MPEESSYTIALIRYLLKGDVPQQPENIDYERLYEFAGSHGVENMIYVALKELNAPVPAETMQKFETANQIQIMVEATQALEFEAISQAFEEEGIDYVPLKGSVIKYLYPMPDYRKSGDIDILVRAEDEERAAAVLIKNFGYSRMDDFDLHDVHSAYKKEPFLEIEIHRQLTHSTDRSYKLFKDIWSLVDRSKDSAHQYEMSNELTYVYLLAHLCKHLYGGGAGIRMIMDFYVMSNKLPLNQELIKEYLRAANLTDLNRYLDKIIQKWFYGTYEYDKDIELLENIILTGGSFGSLEMRDAIHDSSSLNTKLKKATNRIFLSTEQILKYHPEYGENTNSAAVVHFRRLKNILLHGKEKALTETAGIMGNEKADPALKKLVNAICEK